MLRSLRTRLTLLFAGTLLLATVIAGRFAIGLLSDSLQAGGQIKDTQVQGASNGLVQLSSQGFPAGALQLSGVGAVGIDSDGKHLVVRDGGAAKVLIDLRTLSTAPARGVGATHSPPPLLLGAGGAALVALAAGVIAARRRRGQTSASGGDAPNGVDHPGDQ